MNLYQRITDLHNLKYFDDNQAAHTLNAIIEQKDIEALDLFINKPTEDEKWKELAFRWPSVLAPFWREQWYDGWKCVAPIVCQFTKQIADVFDGVSANPQLSDILVNCVFDQIHSKQNRNFDPLNAVAEHAIKTNKPELFDQCIKIFSTNDHGFNILRGFKWLDHIQVSCKIHRVWAMDKVLHATQDDNVFFQILETSKDSLQLDEIQKLYATLTAFSPHNVHAKELLIKKFTTNKKWFSWDTWKMCTQLADQPQSSPINTQHIVNILAMGWHDKSGVPKEDLTSFIDQYIQTCAPVLIGRMLRLCTPVGEELLKHTASNHSNIYEEIFSRMVQSSSGTIRGGCDFEYWLHKINSQTDEILAHYPKSSPILDAWKTKFALLNNIQTPQSNPIRKKM